MIICNTGDAKGADEFWTENLKKYKDKVKVIQWTPRNTLQEDRTQGIQEILKANKVLCRYVQKYLNFLSKNWCQVKYSQVIYASGSLTKPGERGYKGFINKSNITVVEGGTGYAVQMAINNGKKVYFYNQDTDKWMSFDVEKKTWYETGVEKITGDFAGIGSTILTTKTKDTILDLIKKSFE